MTAAAPTTAADPTGRRFTAPALVRERRAAVSRLMFRAPVVVYRLGLGRLLGHQFLVLTHAGRKTGRVHETALKVLRYNPATRESVVASAWGTKTDWYRNIRAQPALTVRTGRDWYVPEQRELGPGEAFAVFEDCTRRQRWFATLMLGQIGLSFEGTEAERRALVARFPVIGLRPRLKGGRRTDRT